MPDSAATLDTRRKQPKKCNLSHSFKQLKYKPTQGKYVDLNTILSIIGYAIFKGYCISENRKKYLDLLYLTKAEFLKTAEIVNSLKLKNSILFNSFMDYFVYGRQ